MFRLMIADDEDAERMGIRFLLHKFGYAFEIREASDGMEALKGLREFPADILMTDVKMPFLNGIELAAKVREQFPDMQIIFFSGYDDFEYVKQALSLQAVDYILKPVDPAEFNRVIGRGVERLMRDKEAITQNKAFLKSYVIARLLNQVSYEKLVQEYDREQLRFLREYTRLIVIEFEEDVFGSVISDIKAFSNLSGGVISGEFDFLDLTPSQGVFFLKRMELKEEHLQELARCIHLVVEKEFGKKCYLAVSERIAGGEDMGNAYRQAERSLEERFFYQDSYVYPRENPAQQEPVKTSDGQLLQAIEKDVACRDGYSLKRNVEILLEVCRNNGFQSYIYTRFVCASLIKILVKELPDGKDRLAGLVEQYIKDHYDQPLSLDLLAEKAFRTPHYLSSIFIQEKGIGINKYIKNVRMEKARELLKNTNMKISDICEQVGYASVSYFCRSFRNEYGVTPEQYRR
ncbi:response regulator [bacterium D16-54]|nr:response regulator [bacterium D16-54]RKJ12552.1 response regulator [bacterium D16-56]